MASEIVTTKAEQTFAISQETLTRVRHMLLDAIKTTAMLERLTTNIRQAADGNFPASVVTKAGMADGSSDLDVFDAAEMVLVLEMLPAADVPVGARAASEEN